jgi:hypothetical protein
VAAGPSQKRYGVGLVEAVEHRRIRRLGRQIETDSELERQTKQRLVRRLRYSRCVATGRGHQVCDQSTSAREQLNQQLPA